ncbi:MAG: HNH endonuclease [Candidatus Pacebacteria bacterium]|nr:HNH endonuclease [Candidatus Paceibacterota bacterium]
MKLSRIYEEELAKEETNFFVLDSGQHTKDVDFETYEWKKSINNKIKTGDLFIYRKPQKMMGRKEFMLFGAGKIGEITGNDSVAAVIEKPHPFVNPIFQSQLDTYSWNWKQRGSNWEHFWNQYGINSIPKQDFTNLLQMVDGEYDPADDVQAIVEDLQIAEGDYSVDDSQAIVSSRPWQSAWSRRVKENYGYMCAVCDLKVPAFLVGSHIVPVRDREFKNTRKDPANGICLCALHDKAFDVGYLGITESGLIRISEQAQHDPVLWKNLSSFSGKRMRNPVRFKPKEEYLAYHRDRIFLS